ncbi:Rieske 2Fe-2S domain-containing protein, partial [Parapedobacter lycopersici]
FNAAEQSWDCPCHGGRFDIAGKVMCGPPRKDLAQVNL